MRKHSFLYGQRLLLVAVVALLAAAGLPFGAGVGTAANPIPERISDSDFWKMTSEFSEPDGNFRSDNLLSNELYFQWVLNDLGRTAKPARVYMGVGPEQNFTYIAELKPRLAFIVDIRRGNMDLQLLYKALFELSADRPDFVSMLFSRKRPAGLSATSTVQEIFVKIDEVRADDASYIANLKAIKDHLMRKHGFALSDDDLAGIEHVYSNFFIYGPDITYNSSSGNTRGGNFRTYAELMTATDEDGKTRSYLASDESFKFLKDFESRNLLIPVIGDFAGPKALRAVGGYLKSIDATVSAFYLSNVEDYLTNGKWESFCANAATLPLDNTSTFIRSVRGGNYGPGGAGGLNSDLGNVLMDLKPCMPEGGRTREAL